MVALNWTLKTVSRLKLRFPNQGDVWSRDSGYVARVDSMNMHFPGGFCFVCVVAAVLLGKPGLFLVEFLLDFAPHSLDFWCWLWKINDVELVYSLI